MDEMNISSEPFLSLFEKFLKEAQKIGIIESYTLKAKETNVSPELGELCLQLTQEVKNLISKDEKSQHSPVEEDIDIIEVVKDQDENNKKKLVQIHVDRNEINRRIKAFMSRKRKEVDEWNIREFCSHLPIEAENPLWEEMESCARVDAVFVPRFGSKSHMKVSKVENRWGPQTKLDGMKRMKKEVDEEVNAPDVSLEAIQERLQNMESHLKLKSDPSLRCNVFERMKQLEDRILFLEGISPDYFHLTASKFSSQKKKSDEKEKIYQNWSVDDIQKRIQALKENLKSKSGQDKQEKKETTE